MKKILFALLLGACCFHAAASAYGNRDLRPHPRLLLTEGGEQRIKDAIAAMPTLGSIDSIVMERADATMNQPPVERIKTGKRLLAVSREALSRIYALSYAYRMTGNTDYALRAESEMLAAAAFSDWNPSHFLDVGEMVTALAIGYDWLFDVLQTESKAAIRRAIVEKGFKAAENPADAWFYNRANNWNSVCNGGLLFGALAIYEDEPAACDSIIGKCLKTNPAVMKCYAPDGGYPEGFEYWGYGTSFQTLLIDALESALGTDFGIAASPGYLESARFIQYMTAPSGMSFNFSDTKPTVKCNYMLYWFAHKLNDPSVVYLENKYLSDKSIKYAEERLLPSLLVFASRLDLKNIPAPEGCFWFSKGNTPVFIYRGGWDSPADTYLGVKGGRAANSHAHMDAGSFVYERQGVRWAMDLGVQEYYSLESKGVDLWNMKQESQRWDVYRIGPDAHNILTVNGDRHNVNGMAEITDTITGPQAKGAVIDLTPVLSPKLESAIRTVLVDSEDNLTITDSVMTPSDADADIKWSMCTPASARIVSANTIELSKDGKTMVMRVDAGGYPVELWTADNQPKHDYDHTNPGTYRVGYATHLPASSNAVLRVSLSMK